MPNAWVTHVKDYAQSRNMKYAHAVTDEECRKTYYEKKQKLPPSEKKSHHKKKPQQQQEGQG